MVKKVLIEVALALCIIFAITGIPTQDKVVHKTESAAEADGLCDCKYDMYQSMRIKAGLSKSELKDVYSSYFSEKTIEYTKVTPVLTQYCYRFILLGAYLLLLAFISGVTSSNSSTYWYFFLPLYESLAYLFSIRSRYKTKKENQDMDNERYINSHLDGALNKINTFLRK